MKCLNCGAEMEQGIVEGYGQGGDSWYEFTSDEEKKKTGFKGFFTRKNIKILPYQADQTAWHCPKCKKVLMWMDTDE